MNKIEQRAQQKFDNEEYRNCALLLSKNKLKNTRLYAKALIALGNYKDALASSDDYMKAYCRYKLGERVDMTDQQKDLHWKLLKTQIMYKEEKFGECLELIDQLLAQMPEDWQYSLHCNRAAVGCFVPESLKSNDGFTAGWEFLYNQACSAVQAGSWGKAREILLEAQGVAQKENDQAGIEQVEMQLDVMDGNDFEPGECELLKVIQYHNNAMRAAALPINYYEQVNIIRDNWQNIGLIRFQYLQILRNAVYLAIRAGRFQYATKLVDDIKDQGVDSNWLDLVKLAVQSKNDINQVLNRLNDLQLSEFVSATQISLYQAIGQHELGRHEESCGELCKLALQCPNSDIGQKAASYVATSFAHRGEYQKLLAFHDSFKSDDQNMRNSFTLDLIQELVNANSDEYRSVAANLLQGYHGPLTKYFLSLQITCTQDIDQKLRLYDQYCKASDVHADNRRFILAKLPRLLPQLPNQCQAPKSLMQESQSKAKSRKRKHKQVSNLTPECVPDPERWLPRSLRKSHEPNGIGTDKKSKKGKCRMVDNEQQPQGKNKSGYSKQNKQIT